MADLLLTYAYILLYIALSGGQIFFNKWVLSSKYMSFPYPVTLTLLHMLFSTLLSFFVAKVVKMDHKISLHLYATSVFPIGAMFAMTLWLGNTAYLYISVAFAQMLKAVMPVAVFLIGAAVGLENPNIKMLSIMLVISLGVFVASYGEINFNWAGVVYQLGGVLGEASRLICIEILLKQKGIKLNPLGMMYYISPCSAFCLFVPWAFLEMPKMDLTQELGSKIWILFLNALCTFALNISVVIVIAHTSAVTIRVAGVVKDWLVVVLSAFLFSDTRLSPINIIGYGVAISGVAAYNKLKFVGPKGEAEKAMPITEATSPSSNQI